MSIPDGRYRARGLQAALGKTKSGNEQVAIEFELLDEPAAGQRITWFGYFTEKTWERTVESLRHCGWEDNDLTNLEGIDRNEVSLVIEAEEYEGKWNPRVKWVNAPGSGIALKEQLQPHEAQSFAARMRGQILAKRPGQKQPARSAPPPQRPQAPATRSGGYLSPEPPPAAFDDRYGPPADDDAPF